MRRGKIVKQARGLYKPDIYKIMSKFAMADEEKVVVLLPEQLKNKELVNQFISAGFKIVKSKYVKYE